MTKNLTRTARTSFHKVFQKRDLGGFSPFIRWHWDVQILAQEIQDTKFEFTKALVFDHAANVILVVADWVLHMQCGHYRPWEYLRIAWYFLARGRSISVKASSHHRHCKQLCGGMEIPCWVKFTCSRKTKLNRLKALLKVLLYANLWHDAQMFSQISRIPDLIRKFYAKRCGL